MKNPNNPNHGKKYYVSTNHMDFGVHHNSQLSSNIKKYDFFMVILNVCPELDWTEVNIFILLMHMNNKRHNAAALTFIIYIIVNIWYCV